MEFNFIFTIGDNYYIICANIVLTSPLDLHINYVTCSQPYYGFPMLDVT